MTLPPHTLSKSDFKIARTCATKLYYREKHYPDTKANDPYLRMLAQGGYMVEMVAKLDFPEGETLEYGRDHAEAAARTMERLRAGDVTLFEATLLDGAYLARADILRKVGNRIDLFEVKASLYDEEEGAERQAKAGSPFRKKPRGKATGHNPILEDWREYLEDVAYQVMVLSNLFPDTAVVPHLVLLRKAYTAPLDGLPGWFAIDEYPAKDGSTRLKGVRFTGDPEVMRQTPMTVAIPVASEVEELLPLVKLEAERFARSLEGPQKIEPVLRWDCRNCEYRVEAGEALNGFAECWHGRLDASYHVLDLYRGGEKVTGFVAEGITSLLDVPIEKLGRKDGELGAHGARQLTQIESCTAGVEWKAADLAPILRQASYPLHFIDFEAAMMAIPHHKGMHPYGRLAFQWSCHTQREPGGPLEHHEWINEADLWPNARFAESLRNVIGEEGTIVTWSHFEEDVLRKIADELLEFDVDKPDLATWLDRTVGTKEAPGARVLDLHKLCEKKYFHPRMGGRTSIKAVLDALWATSPVMRQRFSELEGHEGDPVLGPYAALPPVVLNGVPQQVVEGTGAVRAYEAMMYGVERNLPEVKECWRTLLRQYCRLDTLAMILIREHWLLAP